MGAIVYTTLGTLLALALYGAGYLIFTGKKYDHFLHQDRATSLP